jgi:hypothetical protein
MLSSIPLKVMLFLWTQFMDGWDIVVLGLLRRWWLLWVICSLPQEELEEFILC